MLRAMLFAGLLLPGLANAGLKRQAQNRLHVGTAWTPGSTHAVVGLDSRMSQSIFVDVGAFMSPTEPEKPGGTNAWTLRHGIYVDPGFRVPHRNKSEFKWDIILRGGFAPVWMADSEAQFKLQIMPALNGGGDLMFRYKDWGIRFEARMWYMKPISEYQKIAISTTKPQIGTSLLYQF